MTERIDLGELEPQERAPELGRFCDRSFSPTPVSSPGELAPTFFPTKGGLAEAGFVDIGVLDEIIEAPRVRASDIYDAVAALQHSIPQSGWVDLYHAHCSPTRDALLRALPDTVTVRVWTGDDV